MENFIFVLWIMVEVLAARKPDIGNLTPLQLLLSWIFDNVSIIFIRKQNIYIATVSVFLATEKFSPTES